MNTRYFFFFIAAFVLAACTQLENPAESNVPVSLSYSTVAATETKAAQNLNEGTFTSGESIKVRISNAGASSWTDFDFTTGDAGAMSPAGTVPYYPAGAQNIDIVAYYPATAGSSFSVATDQTADASYKASDLMFASVTDQARQAEAVNLAFTHKMAKLCVNITAGQGVTSISSVSILNVKPTVSFDQATGAVGEASGDATTIVMSNNGAAVIPAQTIDGGLLSIVTDKGTAIYSVASKAFAAGQLYTMNITVNLRAVGATTAITGWTSEGTVTVNPVTYQKTPASLVAVDLGHPSIKWANMNLGAISETDYGDYFAWGETVPYYQEGFSQESPCTHWIAGKLSYSWSYYSLCNGTQNTMNKYCTNGDYGYVDNKTVLERTNDAASANWGGNWRMPTDDEWRWLRSNCTWTWTTQSGVKGYLVEGNGNSIFLPAAGYWIGDYLYHAGSTGQYWSSSLYDNKSYNAWYVGIDINDGVYGGGEYRYRGQSIRPVTE